MKTEPRYRLADSTVAEPLVHRWPAWAQLLSPATSGLHLLHHQIPTLESYLQDPASHVRLARDPDFAGGPFSDVPPERAAEIRQLLEECRGRRAGLEFARDVAEFHNRLVDEAGGLSLEPYYERLPESLRGYVELVYDYYHNPSMRFLEGLLYESENYDPSLQSLHLFRLRHDPRPFFMSTPRLPEPDRLDWRVPFDSPLVDEFFRLDLEPQPLERVREIVGLTPADDPLLLPLLSAEQARKPEPWRGSAARVRYFGHACVLVEWNGVSMLTDPYIPARPSEGGAARYSYDDLPEHIDFALVTHNHQDHFALETLLRLRPRIGCLVVPRSYGLLFGDVSLKLLARKIGFKNVLELDTLESIPLPDGEILGVPFYGEHGDLAHGKIGFLVRAGKEQMLFAADSDCLDRRMYERLRGVVGPVENVFLGTESVGAPLTWHNGALFFRRPTREQDQTRRYHGCNARTALQLLEAVGARRVYNYAMGKEPWLEYLLGLGTGADSPQLRESREMIARARGRGFEVAERPFGRGEIYLGGAGACDDAAAAPRAVSFSEAPPAGSLEARQAYWREQLGGSLPALTLPKNEGGGREFIPVGHTFAFTATQADALREFARSRGHGLPLVMLAAFDALLYPYAERDEIVIGATARDLFGDSADAHEGAASNTLPLRTDLSGEPKFTDLLARVGAVARMALENGGVPPETFESACGAAARLFQVTYRFGEGAAPTTSEEVCAGLDLSLAVYEGEQGLMASFNYDAASFEAETVSALAARYRAVLESAVERPEQTIVELTFAGTGDVLAAPESVEDLEDQFVF